VNPKSKLRLLAAACCIGLLMLAFVAAPHSCEWGLSAYVWSGLAALLLMLVSPFLLRSDLPPARRTGLALGYGALLFGVWTLGLFAANVRILCRLF
jgi:multidrug transporter EmrE-like cation transporter